jgi:hypothetical protein
LEAAPAAKEGILAHRSRCSHRGFGGLVALLGLLVLSGVPGAARAAEQYTYSVGVLGGIGGSVDVDRGDNLNNTGFQLNLAMVTEPRTHVGFRIGKLNLDKNEFFGSLTNADLSYVTVAGEYRFQESYYESGVFLGLGGYRLSGNRASDGRADDQTSVGLTVGVTGELTINRWLGVLLEVSGHYVNLDEAKIYGMAHGGVAVHF